MIRIDFSHLRKLFSKKDMSVYGATDKGKKRDNNEDNFILLAEKNIFVVSDGMGGHNAGEVASLKACETVERHFSSREAAGIAESIEEEMKNSVKEVNEEVKSMSRSKPEYSGMGCTIVVAFIYDYKVHTCHVGDSRAYVINKSGISQLTRDHSVVREMIDLGKMKEEEARHSRLKDELTQAVGSPYPFSPEYTCSQLNKEDIVLLCSDGLWDMLTDDEIRDEVMRDSSLKKACQRLIRKANSAGGEDNITVVLVKVK